MSSNKTFIQDEQGQYDDWFEVYNAGPNNIDLQSYFFSDNPANPQKWEVTASVIIPVGAYVVFWADEDQSQGPTHTNFKLSASGGETVSIANPSGTVLDQILLPAIQDDYSYGRQTDGSSGLSTFSLPSPNSSNSTGTSRVEDVDFSVPAGVYTSAQTVLLTTATPGATIRYTLNGSEPTGSSTVYSSAITINNVNTVRAKAFRSGWQASETTSASYLVGANHSLPIVTINTHPDNLWDDEIGIYVKGTNGIVGHCNSTPHNYSQPWERPANIQFFEQSGSQGFNIDAGISIAGGCSRRNAQKGMNIETKSIYPSENIPYQLFPNRDQHKFRRFKLRAGGNDWNLSALRDASTHRFVEDEVDVDLQSVRPVILYLNDEYWGVMNIRDVHSQHSINYKHPKVKKDSLNIFKASLYDPVNIYDFDLKEGQADDFLSLYNYIANNNLANATHYNYVKDKIDIKEFINYQLLQIFVANTDWPSNNLDIWYEQQGKARWLLYDTDFGLGRQWSGSNPRTANPPAFDAISAATQQTQSGWPNDKAGTRILYKLLQNSDFKNEFVQRYATQLSILFTSARTTGIVNDLRNEMAPEMQSQLTKFNLNGGSLANWNADVDAVVNWLNQRPAHVYTNIQNFFGTGGTYNLTIPVTSSTNGRVLLNENEYLAPYNYTGKYFDGIPMTVTAVADPGYRFSHWQETGTTTAKITPSYSTNTTLTPVFVAAPDVAINEIHYNPAGSSEEAEFIELYNPGTSPRDLSTFEFVDGICFEFPDNTIINPGEYIIIAHDATVYSGQGYQVFEWEDSSLNNDGEHLSLANGAGQIIDSLTYNDVNGWASTADNGFYSLALLDSDLDNSQGISWDVQSVYMTPGAQNQFLPYDTYHFPSNLVINELHYFPFDSVTPAGDTLGGKNYEFIELKNKSSSPVSLTGVALSRGVTYEFPAGSTIPGNGFLVIAEDSLQFIERYGFSPYGRYSGKLSNLGELVWLSNSSGQLMDAVRYDEAFPWDTNANGGIKDYSLALIDETKDNANYLNWKRQCTALQTPNAANDFGCFEGLSYAGLTINEIHYNPNGGSSYEYIEIVNHAQGALNLKDLSLASGITYDFEGDVYLPGAAASPLNYIVLANDAAVFQNHYGFAPYGEYFGTLSNYGERIAIEDFFGDVVEEVTYDDVAPWDVLADQGQHSLALISGSLDNELASSWCTQSSSSKLTPKAPNVFNDSDSDGIVDCIDVCPALDDGLINMSCNDGDPCTIGETYDTTCNCSGGVFQDADNDGVCDVNDICPGSDDTVDNNNNGIPDGCENASSCVDYVNDMMGNTIGQDTSAQISIISNGIVQTGNNIEYYAGNRVELVQGFEVKTGATFHAFIAPCN